MIFSLSCGVFLSALNVKFRDVKFIIPFLLQIGFYICPVFLSTSFYTSRLSESLSFLYMTNPLVTIIEGFKYCLLGGQFTIAAAPMAIGILITIFLMVFSLKYFVKFERTFADYI
jgi:lipopolysaccharide transport system permease protein